MKTTMTRKTCTANAMEETKEDESSSSYISTGVLEGKGRKNVDVNIFGENNDEGKNDLLSAIKKKTGKKNMKRGGGGDGKKIRDI